MQCLQCIKLCSATQMFMLVTTREEAQIEGLSAPLREIMQLRLLGLRESLEKIFAVAS